MASVTTEAVTLNTGTEMPVLGLGTWQLAGDDAVEGARHALEIGYRLIDTADDYYNQHELGEGLRASPVERDEVFVVSKVEEDEDSYQGTRQRVADLGVDRLDMCLIHRSPPSGAGEELWEGLIRARREGLTREIGVSNYTSEQVDRLIEATGETPVVNQIEWSPFGHSQEVLDHARERGVVIQAYSPLTRMKRLDDDTLAEIGAAHGKTPAQVLLRWDIQVGTATVPKAGSARHREENLAIFDFELDDGELRRLSALNEHYSSLASLPYV
ncbi:MAG: aldo/keto reductase [Thermoleophilaceae bacterium]